MDDPLDRLHDAAREALAATVAAYRDDPGLDVERQFRGEMELRGHALSDAEWIDDLVALVEASLTGQARR